MPKKRKKDKTYMPTSMAGLMSFYQEEKEGVKIRPEFVILFCVGVVITEIVARIFL